MLCGGGDPFAEFEHAKNLIAEAGQTYTIFAGNDMIELCPEEITHAITLHPDKLQKWLPRRKAKGLAAPQRVWAHRNYNSNITDWTRDWAGSTGLFCIKIARELGYTHIVACGVHMKAESKHFVRGVEWEAVTGFMRSWFLHTQELKPYLRTFGGWTLERFGAPTVEWLRAEIEDKHRPNGPQLGLRA